MIIDLPFQAKLYHIIEHISPQHTRSRDLCHSEIVELMGSEAADQLTNPFNEDRLVCWNFNSVHNCVINDIKIAIRLRDPVFQLPCGSWFFYLFTGCDDIKNGAMCGPHSSYNETRNSFVGWYSW